jgi:hypothetical protein
VDHIAENQKGDDEPDDTVAVLFTRYAGTIGAALRLRRPVFAAIERVAAKEAQDHAASV